MDYPTKRISIMIGEHQHDMIVKNGLNISGLIRDLIEDHFSSSKITLAVSEKTSQLYSKIVANTGATDTDIEPFFTEALQNMLKARIKKMEQLSEELEKQSVKP
jgi:hypothetical protein